MALACIPQPFKGCSHFQEQLLETIGGVSLDLASIAQVQQLVIITVDANVSFPSAASILFELFQPLLIANQGVEAPIWPSAAPPPGRHMSADLLADDIDIAGAASTPHLNSQLLARDCACVFCPHHLLPTITTHTHTRSEGQKQRRTFT